MGFTIVLLFSSVSAICVGVLLYAGIGEQHDWISQFTVFFMLTAFFTLALWRPLKRLTGGKRADIHDQPLHNIVGQDVVVVGNALVPGKEGQVRWSGTIVRAMLAEGVNQEFQVDAVLVVVDVKGNIFIINKK